MKTLVISQILHDQILRWAVCSRKEINIVCFGLNDRIKKVERLRNPERYGRYTASINNREYRDVIQKYRSLKVIACGHSHIGGPARPSKGDMPPTITAGKIELIVCTKSRTITAWKIHKTRAATIKKGRVALLVLENDKSLQDPRCSYEKRKVGSSQRVTRFTRKRTR